MDLIDNNNSNSKGISNNAKVYKSDFNWDIRAID